ncbi:TSHSV-HP7 [Trionyx sinensis hemorrhagic syndrome virus]|uniref:TSHSV-HP7 n=1 Tax=Trionyx sinensis hemorrhagic syndrome virus TaxID=1705352 RepID=A0AAE7J0T3_9NIDO|nr:TSHSV-HP7 [Trionyx sinensis hemorrhagic syndrome virus]QNI38738.1 TSHSV-HP7 [Trionyx sinensis hemorrhagic syndrome virus]
MDENHHTFHSRHRRSIYGVLGNYVNDSVSAKLSFANITGGQISLTKSALIPLYECSDASVFLAMGGCFEDGGQRFCLNMLNTKVTYYEEVDAPTSSSTPASSTTAPPEIANFSIGPTPNVAIINGWGLNFKMPTYFYRHGLKNRTGQSWPLLSFVLYSSMVEPGTHDIGGYTGFVNKTIKVFNSTYQWYYRFAAVSDNYTHAVPEGFFYHPLTPIGYCARQFPVHTPYYSICGKLYSIKHNANMVFYCQNTSITCDTSSVTCHWAWWEEEQCSYNGVTLKRYTGNMCIPIIHEYFPHWISTRKEISTPTQHFISGLVLFAALVCAWIR